MSDQNDHEAAIGQCSESRLWIVFRFFVVGIGGVPVMLSFLTALDETMAKRVSFVSPFQSLPLAFTGALMMLFGASARGRWAHLWVFLCLPRGLGLLITLLNARKELGALLVAGPLLVSYPIVRRYYRNLAVRQLDCA